MANNYTVTFDANGGGTPSQATKEVTFDSAYGALATVSRTGYDFVTWSTTASGAGTNIDANSIVSIGNNHSLYARWSAKEYVAYLNPESNTADFIRPTYDAAMPSTGVNSVNPDTGELINPPQTVTLTAPSQSGYTFNGYYVGSTQYYTNTMASART